MSDWMDLEASVEMLTEDLTRVNTAIVANKAAKIRAQKHLDHLNERGTALAKEAGQIRRELRADKNEMRIIELENELARLRKEQEDHERRTEEGAGSVGGAATG